MPRCDCGALVAHYILHTESPDGRPLAESYTSCPECRPEEFPVDQPFALSLDRLVTGPEAMPHLYKLGPDGVYRPTDELQQDTQDRICAEGPTARALRIKSETRRTAPMNEAEIREADQVWRNRLQNSN